MGRRRGTGKRQAFHFPSQESAAEMPGMSALNLETPTAKDAAKDATEKREIKKAVDALPEIFAPDQVVFIFDIYTGAISFIYSFLLKVDFKLVFEELKMDENEKAMLAKPLARVASKYAPSNWAGMQAEIELCTSLGMYTVMGFRRAQSVAEKEKEAKKKEAEIARHPHSTVSRPVAVPVG